MTNLLNIWKYDLYIFDLDDTLVKSEKYHYDAWMLTLKDRLNDRPFNLSFNDFCENFHSIDPNGIKNYIKKTLKISDNVSDKEVSDKEVSDIIKQKNEIYLNLLKAVDKRLQMIDGAELFLNEILNRGKQFVIVSNSPLSNIEFFSEYFPILKKSSKNYYREILKERKPHPECYQTVVKDFAHLNKKIGFEDSITGIMSLIQVPEIDPIFVNNEFYVHYIKVIKTYPNLLVIEKYY
jgi:beta-phosphoglucomutase-like phosphatase (HAD superfamily)